MVSGFKRSSPSSFYSHSHILIFFYQLIRSWTFILTPIWVMDIMTFVLIYVRRPSDTYTTNPLIYYCLAAKVAFQLLLVIRLDLFEAMPIYVIMSPLWCFLFMAATNLFQTIIIAPIDVN